jgi:tetratricopeptide (TPR) repeat protein
MPHDDVYFCRGPERHVWVDPEDAEKCCNGYERGHHNVVGPDGDVYLEFYWHPVGEPQPELVDLQPSEHMPFVRRLAELATFSPNERVALSPPISAGWLTLRFAEDWMADGDRPLRQSVAVQGAVDDLPTGPDRDVLIRIIKHVRGEPAPGHTMCSLLVLYGAVLEDQSEWTLAADVYRMVVVNANRLREPEARPTAYERLAYCLRQTGAIDEANTALRDGLRTARVLGDRVGELRLELAAANAAAHAGNYPEATRRPDALIETARREGHRSMLALALHDRGIVAHDRDDAERAVALLYEAITTFESESRRQRAQGDLAAVFVALGWLDAAIDVLLPLYHGAVHRECRLNAAINMMDIAARQGRVRAFVRLQTELHGQELPARMRASYLLVLADGYRRLECDAALETYRDALAFANRHGLHRHAWRANAALRGAASIEPVRPRAVPSHLERVVADVHDRRVALVGAV